MNPTETDPTTERRIRAVVLMLAAVGGWLDGLTFLTLGGVFVSAMTGNFVQFGSSLGNGEWAQFACLMTAVTTAFLGGAVAVFMVRRTGQAAWPGPVRRPLTLQFGVLVALVIAWFLFDSPDAFTFGAFVVVAIAGFAAGLQGASILGLKIKGAGVNAITAVLFLVSADFVERATKVEGPKAALPPAILVGLLLAYASGGLIVTLAYDDFPRAIVLGPLVISGLVLAILRTENVRSQQEESKDLTT
ncbi:MAG: DUF1275 domain-containing protein [Solirubrobacterales bacterium]|nr:DUF1275 domain-containing protein [Solirubrobacterales bacterium]